jgi:hypothetical protein
VDMYLSRKPPMTHVFPFSLILRPWAPGPDFLLQCKKVWAGLSVPALQQ